ncbi:hypothetical protein SCLCIDRAFT_140489, partial [Scleroderma citrinum Foug A]
RRTFTAPDGRSYKWVIDFSIVRVSMPVARSHRRSYGIIGSKQDPYLEIHPDLAHILDTVILTFIYVEKLRMDEDAAKYSA